LNDLLFKDGFEDADMIGFLVLTLLLFSDFNFKVSANHFSGLFFNFLDS